MKLIGLEEHWCPRELFDHEGSPGYATMSGVRRLFSPEQLEAVYESYTILEDSLNLKDSRVYDTIMEDGKEKRVLNKKETTIASQKQEAIREAFKDWVFRDPERRQTLVAKYNVLFNSTRPREYDGSHLKFPGMTPDIELKPH